MRFLLSRELHLSSSCGGVSSCIIIFCHIRGQLGKIRGRQRDEAEGTRNAPLPCPTSVAGEDNRRLTAILSSQNQRDSKLSTRDRVGDFRYICWLFRDGWYLSNALRQDMLLDDMRMRRLVSPLKSDVRGRLK